MIFVALFGAIEQSDSEYDRKNMMINNINSLWVSPSRQMHMTGTGHVVWLIGSLVRCGTCHGSMGAFSEFLLRMLSPFVAAKNPI